MKKIKPGITLVILVAFGLAACAPAATSAPAAASTQLPLPTLPPEQVVATAAAVLETAVAALPPTPTTEPTATKPVPSPTARPPTESAPAATATEASPPVEHVLVPVTFGADPGTILDTSSEATSDERRAPAGDDYTSGRLERPFSLEMKYLPHLDIVNASHARRIDFYYFSLQLVGDPHKAAGDPPAYGFELDVNLDGRGDFMLFASKVPGSEWGQEGLQLWQDTNDSVGGSDVVVSDVDPGKGGNGYDLLAWESGQAENPDLAWVRLLTDPETRLEFALLPSELPQNQIFMWYGFADGYVHDPGRYDYVDLFKPEVAGNAMKENSNYPLKEFYAYDNTCRATSGFEPFGNEPGLCPDIIPPKAESGGKVGVPWIPPCNPQNPAAACP